MRASQAITPAEGAEACLRGPPRPLQKPEGLAATQQALAVPGLSRHGVETLGLLRGPTDL